MDCILPFTFSADLLSYVFFFFLSFMCHIASVTWSSHWSYPFSQDYVGWTAKINHSWVIIEPKFRASVEDLLGLGLCNGMDLEQEDPQQISDFFIDKHSHPRHLLVL